MDDYCRFVHFFPNVGAGRSWCRRHPETFLITPEKTVPPWQLRQFAGHAVSKQTP